ncbi:MAG: hypothetical protein ABEH43_05960 [Flavobacteriales bacterium]
MRIAVLDLGTNTFNLLIAEKRNDQGIDILHRTKYPAKLGEGGIHKSFIAPKAMKRGLDAVLHHYEMIKEYNCNKTIAFATSAIRSANNGKEFVKILKDRFDLDVNIIDGDQEADLIHKGVSYSMDLGEEPELIMDIGGGSTEFIIANKKRLFWKHSFNAGAARLLEEINPSDPIQNEEVNNTKIWLAQELNSLYEKVKEYKPKRLIGCAGSFESISFVIAHRENNPQKYEGYVHYPINIHKFYELYHLFLNSTISERLAIKGLEPVRADMIVMASILISEVIENCNIIKLHCTTYALREGVLFEELYDRL